jgi:uncharacterized protein
VENARLKELVEYMARSLVDHPDRVRVVEAPGSRSVVLELHVAGADMGRVIGKGGRVATAMRSVLYVAASRAGTRATLEIMS